MKNKLKISDDGITVFCECGNVHEISEDENEKLILETFFRTKKNESTEPAGIESGTTEPGTTEPEPGKEKKEVKKRKSGLSIFNR